MNSKRLTSVIFSSCIAMGFAHFSIAQKGKEKEKEIFNFSFEGAKGTVSELGQFDLLGDEVLSTMDTKADLFMKDASADYGVPSNIFGSEIPKNDKGESYGGIIAYKPGKNGDMERSYYTFELKGGRNKVTMKKGLKYCVSYDVSLAESSKYAINNLGLYFSKSAFGAEPPIPGNNDEHLVLNATKDRVPRRIIKGFYGWERVGNVYTAKGDENFISIGNFQKNAAYNATDTPWKFEVVKKPKESEVESKGHAYYYVDNISIRLIDKVEECDCYMPVVRNVADSFSQIIYKKAIEIDEKMSLAQKVEAHEIHFRGGQSKFTSNALENLTFISDAMKKDPKMSIEVIGHIDVKEEMAGTVEDEYKDLDKERAKVVINYLIKNGIDATRLK